MAVTLFAGSTYCIAVATTAGMRCDQRPAARARSRDDVGSERLLD